MARTALLICAFLQSTQGAKVTQLRGLAPQPSLVAVKDEIKKTEEAELSNTAVSVHDLHTVVSDATNVFGSGNQIEHTTENDDDTLDMSRPEEKKEEKKVSRKDMADPSFEVVKLGLERESAEAGWNVGQPTPDFDVHIVKARTEMVLPDEFVVSIVTTPPPSKK